MNPTYSRILKGIEEHFGSGPMSEIERSYLIAIQRLIGAAMRGEVGFADVLNILMMDIGELHRHECDLGTMLNKGVVSAVLDELDALQRQPVAENDKGMPLSGGQSKFLQDISRTIEFALRNGVGFHFPFEIIEHDIKEVRLIHNGDIDQALKQCFHPKSANWANIDEDSFGEVEEA